MRIFNKNLTSAAVTWSLQKTILPPLPAWGVREASHHHCCPHSLALLSPLVFLSLLPVQSSLEVQQVKSTEWTQHLQLHENGMMVSPWESLTETSTGKWGSKMPQISCTAAQFTLHVCQQEVLESTLVSMLPAQRLVAPYLCCVVTITSSSSLSSAPLCTGEKEIEEN